MAFGGAALLFVVMPAVVFSFAYFPIVNSLTRGLASPYAKVDVRRRLYSAATDGGLVVTGLVFYSATGALVFLLAATAYLLLRDSYGGRSVGKSLFGLVVVNLESNRPASAMSSLRRNVVFVLPGANVAAVFLETITVVRDPQGQRLGDRIAHTQVVDGFGAKDLARRLAEWWGSVLSEGPRAARPGRRPGLTVEAIA